MGDDILIDPRIDYPPVPPDPSGNNSQNLALQAFRIYCIKFSNLPLLDTILTVSGILHGSSQFLIYSSAFIFANDGTHEWNNRKSYSLTDVIGTKTHSGRLWVSVMSGLPAGETVDYVVVDLLSSHGFVDWFAVVYADNGSGDPGTLLGYSGGKGNGQGQSVCQLINPIGIPADGKLWVGVYSNVFPSFGYRDNAHGGAGGRISSPTGLPVTDPPPGNFPSPTSTEDDIWFKVHYSRPATHDVPGNLLAYSSPVRTGDNQTSSEIDFNLLAPLDTSPASIWVGFAGNGVTGVCSSTFIPEGYCATNKFSNLITFPSGVPTTNPPSFFGVTEWQDNELFGVPSSSIDPNAKPQRRQAYWTKLKLTKGWDQGHIIG